MDHILRLLNGYKIKKATINPKNDDDNCFQYAITVALTYDKMSKNHQRANKIKKYTSQYDWSEKNVQSHVDDWKKFELNSKPIALNVLYIPEGEIK